MTQSRASMTGTFPAYTGGNWSADGYQRESWLFLALDDDGSGLVPVRVALRELHAAGLRDSDSRIAGQVRRRWRGAAGGPGTDGHLHLVTAPRWRRQQRAWRGFRPAAGPRVHAAHVRQRPSRSRTRRPPHTSVASTRAAGGRGDALGRGGRRPRVDPAPRVVAWGAVIGPRDNRERMASAAPAPASRFGPLLTGCRRAETNRTVVDSFASALRRWAWQLPYVSASHHTRAQP